MERLIVHEEPGSLITKAYRILCTNVLSRHNERIIEVVGVAENNNTSLVVANLAVAIAQAGKSILLVDCNLHTPKQHELFALQNSGVTDCIITGDSYKSYVQATRQVNLSVLTAGTAVENPVEMLLSGAMQKVLKESRETYDIVLLDLPSIAAASDAVALGIHADSVLLVLTNKQDKVEQAKKAKEVFLQAGVPILGCVLDKVPVKSM